MDNQPSVGIAIITHNAKHHLPHCLPPLLNSSLKPKVLVVNSSSNDGTVETAVELGAETLVIPRKEFNHGKTRERARKALNTDIVVMMTPDAYLTHEESLLKLIEPLQKGEASISYARQVSHRPHQFFETFPRKFNYPTSSQIRSIEDTKKYGVYTFFCSNSCAAWKNQALDEIGGFDQVLLGEDTVATAKLLRKGHKIAYVAEAEVQHSHEYDLIAEFRRSFDTGIARKSYENLLQCEQGDVSRGGDYVRKMLRELLRVSPLMIPYAIVQCVMKFVGYQMGRCATRAPRWLKRTLSSQSFYWN